MLKWLLTLVVALLLSGLLSHGLRRLGIARLPGDFEFKGRHGRLVYAREGVPFAGWKSLPELATAP